MKVIGLIGGMSWESTAEYYRIINESVKERLEGFHSAKILLYSVNLDQIVSLQRDSRWQQATEIVCDAAWRVQRGGADCLLICTNTMHKMAEEVQDAVNIPLIHIADATAIEIKRTGISQVALLATQYTMEEDFYKGHLAVDHNLEVMIPPEKDRRIVNHFIYEELCLGKVLADSRKQFVRIIEDMTARGAQGIILGCTELPLLLDQKDSPLKLFNTTLIHARAAVDFALND